MNIKPVKGRAMLTWIGKHPIDKVNYYPAQLEEVCNVDNPAIKLTSFTLTRRSPVVQTMYGRSHYAAKRRNWRLKGTPLPSRYNTPTSGQMIPIFNSCMNG